MSTPAGERVPFALLQNMFEQSKTRMPTKYPTLKSKAAQARHAVACLARVANVLLVGKHEF
eukprot:2319489-Alexandrium_andersonii.AAC.1